MPQGSGARETARGDYAVSGSSVARVCGGGVSAAALITRAKARRRTAMPTASPGIGSPNTIGPAAIVVTFAAADVVAITGTARPR